jgi:hypothetical protein
MSFREILKTEIWSERTSKRILLILGFVVVLIFAGNEIRGLINAYWLTNHERQVARIALKQIDSLQNADSLSDAEFQSRINQAQTRIDDAENAAWTTRDTATAMGLGMCLMPYEAKRIEMNRARLVQEGRIKKELAETENDQVSRISSEQTSHMLCNIVRKDLD